MAENFSSKLRILFISSAALSLLLAFQNCVKMSAGVTGSTTTLASNDTQGPDTTLGTLPIIDPPADPPENGGGGTEPEPIDTTNAVVQYAANCLNVVSSAEESEGLLSLQVQLLADNSVVVPESGLLIVDGTEHEATSIDSETGILKFHVAAALLKNGAISGSFGVSGYSTIVGQCLID